MSRLVLGTRGSDLARAQTALVEVALRVRHPELEISVEIIRTSGDERGGRSPEIVDRHAGRKGMFTAEIEHALLASRIDVAVHSAKDLPSDAAAELQVCGALPRAAVEDVLIAKTAENLNALLSGATIATGSVRRQHQLRWCRPDLQIVDLRGNVPTRLRKLSENDWDGIVLARAGLERLGCELTTFRSAILPVERFLPAGGQGIIALQVRLGDTDAQRLVAAIGDAEALQCLRAEREFLRLLQGDCGTPVGVLARLSNGEMTLQAQVFAEGATEPRSGHVRGIIGGQDPEALARTLFQEMYGNEN
ncbi:MAG: hydroxymethylbilane synthase [Chthoniobacterales bacterium]